MNLNLKVAIIGAGPNGISMALALQKTFPSIEFVIYEKEPSIAGGLGCLPEVRWHSQMHELTLGFELDRLLNAEARPFTSELVAYYRCAPIAIQAKILFSTEVRSIRAAKKNSKKRFEIHAKQERKIIEAAEYDYIIDCSGISANRIYENVLTKFRDFRTDLDINIAEKKILLLGGGNSSIDALIHLLPNNQVTWIIRGESARPIFPSVQADFERVINSNPGNLERRSNVAVTDVGSSGRSAYLSDGTVVDDIDVCMALWGFHSVSRHHEDLNLEYENTCISLKPSFETSVQGLYIFGSLAQRYDSEGARIQQTFIHNGNPRDAERIIEDIRSAESIERINRLGFDCNLISEKRVELFIIAHPDDEVLFFGEAILNSPNPVIICLTNARNRVRQEAALRSFAVLKAKGAVWDYEDGASFDCPELRGQIEHLFQTLDISTVYTHGNDGEYGHQHHIKTSMIVQAIAARKNIRLVSPKFINRRSKIIEAGTLQEALRCYWPKLSLPIRNGSLDFVEFYTSNALNIDMGDLHHIWAMQFLESATSAGANDLSPLPGSIEVYRERRPFYDELLDRKYIIFEYLPNCFGRTLSVGCHEFNKDDFRCVPVGSEYLTCDLAEEYSQWGSPTWHKTIDFLELSRVALGGAVSNFVLFGVLGIPMGTGGDRYSMYESPERIADKVEELIGYNNLGNQRVLLGPDIFHDKSVGLGEKISYWFRFVDELFLKRGYVIRRSFQTTRNLVFDLERSR